MPVPFRLAVFVVVSILLAGCSSLASVPAGTPGQQVQTRYGAPNAVWKNTDGTQSWEYAFGPAGFQTYMVTVGPDQSVRNVHQVLSDEYFSRIQSGMSREEVQHMIGRPKEIFYFPARDEETWTWRYIDGRNMFFHVLFDRSRGTVRSTQRIEDFDMVPDSM